MSFRQDLALALSPDLRDIVRRLEEIDRALEVDIRNLAEPRQSTASAHVLVDIVKDDLIETRTRLAEVLGVLTGRRPNRG